MAEYWRLWNMPVHKWLLRHVYYPCMRLGMGKWWAGTVVFAISAAFHELLIGLPLHMVKLWAFIGLMFQACFLCLSRANTAVHTSYTQWAGLPGLLAPAQAESDHCSCCVLAPLLPDHYGT